jgi:hypothetical protein
MAYTSVDPVKQLDQHNAALNDAARYRGILNNNAPVDTGQLTAYTRHKNTMFWLPNLPAIFGSPIPVPMRVIELTAQQLPTPASLSCSLTCKNVSAATYNLGDVPDTKYYLKRSNYNVFVEYVTVILQQNFTGLAALPCKRADTASGAGNYYFYFCLYREVSTPHPNLLRNRAGINNIELIPPGGGGGSDTSGMRIPSH